MCNSCMKWKTEAGLTGSALTVMLRRFLYCDGYILDPPVVTNTLFLDPVIKGRSAAMLVRMAPKSHEVVVRR